MQTYWWRGQSWRIVALLLPSLLTTSTLKGQAITEKPSRRVVLNQATLAIDADQPSYVQFAVEELAGYLKDSTGMNIKIAASPVQAGQVQILVGPKTVGKVFPSAIPDEKLGEEGYRLACLAREGAQYVVATGSTPRGTKMALATLIKAVRVENHVAYVPASLQMLGKPGYAKRGMHLNGWPLNYPYSFRNWREADWQRYLDLLSYQGVNLFYLWPFIEIMPVSLSAEDRAYLEECRRVVDYAQKKHGMEVWIMQCANRVARDRCGVADPRLRPYWRPSQEDLDPGRPENLKAILASREAMYRILDNANGVCNIDSDPGFFAGSPLSDYVKVLQGCRALLDRHNQHGKQAKLINWMLWGWGRKEKMQLKGLAQHQLLALRELKQGLPEPFWLISGQFPEYLPMCRDEGLIARTVYLPYGAIEWEPAYPRTQVHIDGIRAMFERPDARFPEIAGIMGNVQTPLLQFPNLYFFTSVITDFDYRTRSESEVLMDLAVYLYPDHKQLMAKGFSALDESNPAKVETLAGQLRELLRNDALGRPGLFTRKLYPNYRIVAKNLHLQLVLRAARQRLMAGMGPNTSKDECIRLLGDYFDAYLMWDHTHGWHQLWGWKTWVLPGLPVPVLAKKLRKSLPNNEDLEACFDTVTQRLSAKYDADAVESGCIAPVKSVISR